MTATSSTRDRRPRWVYAVGQEPDYRFSFANERTFLAWIRTALALVAAGVALDALDLELDPMVRKAVALTLILVGMLCAGAGWVRWARAERAMRNGARLPATPLGLVLTVCVVLVASTLAFVI